MKSKSFLFSLSVIVFGLISIGITSSNFATYAETSVGSEIDIESSGEIKIGDDDQTKLDASSETKSEISSETKISSESEHESESHTSMESESSVQMNIKSYYPAMSANSENSFVIQSKNNLYVPGQSVHVEGSLWASLMSKIGSGNTALIQILDSQGMVVSEQTVDVSANGEFHSDIMLPSSAVNGEYVIESKINSESSLLGSLDATTLASLESTTTIIVATPTLIQINIDGHDAFDVNIASNSKVSAVEFKEQEKKISFIVDGETGTKGTTQISIPKELLSGHMTVMIDGQVMAADDVIISSNTEATTTLEINYHHSVHQIDIIGTNAVPEFGTIASLILVVSIISVITISAKTQLMPKI